jgi:hypothetical protein
VAGFKINLPVVLKHLDCNNLEVYSAFEHRETERKELTRLLDYVLPLWMTGIGSSIEQYEMVLAFNQHVNSSWAELKNHPELRAKLLGVIGSGKPVRHEFHKREAATSQTSLTGLLTMCYPDIRNDEVALWCTVNNEATLRELCDRYGVQETDRHGIIAEYREVVQ